MRRVVTGAQLDAYVAAGISSDHECSTEYEALSKLRRGMHLFLREGSAARNLQALLPVISSETEHRLAFCTDDRDAADLLREGSIDHLVRMAVAAGVPYVTALRIACFNPAQHYRLTDRGLIAPGRRADIIAFASLEDFRPRMVWQVGRLVAKDGKDDRRLGRASRYSVHARFCKIPFTSHGKAWICVFLLKGQGFASSECWKGSCLPNSVFFQENCSTESCWQIPNVIF